MSNINRTSRRRSFVNNVGRDHDRRERRLARALSLVLTASV
jgi:hypothetical protein